MAYSVRFQLSTCKFTVFVKLDPLMMVLEFISDGSSIIVFAETILFKLWSHCHLCHPGDVYCFNCYGDLSVCLLYTSALNFTSYQKNDILIFATNILLMFHKMVFNGPVTITVILVDLCFSCINYHLSNVWHLGLLYRQLILSLCYPSSRCVKAFSLTEMLFSRFFFFGKSVFLFTIYIMFRYCMPLHVWGQRRHN